MKSGKPSKILPSRSGLQALDKSQRTILDYGKASPITQKEPSPAVILNLAKS